MRPWHYGLIFAFLLLAIIPIAKLRGYHRIVTVAKKTAGLLCVLCAGFFGILGVVYITSDIIGWVLIRIKHIDYAEGPGLGFMIGLSFVFLISLPLLILGKFFLKYQSGSQKQA